MTKPHYSELVFDVTERADGGHTAECLSENIVTQGDTWEELRANVKEPVEAFFDGPKPQAIRLHLVPDELFLVPSAMRIPRDSGGRELADALCRHWDYKEVY
jgi:predicted RNase H-like HicB family nuclease